MIFRPHGQTTAIRAVQHVRQQHDAAVRANLMRQQVLRNNALLTMRPAVALATAAAAEQGIAIGASSVDSAEAFIERMNALPVAQRRALIERLSGVILALFTAAEFLTRMRIFGAAAVFLGVALAVYVLRNAVAEIEDDTETE